MLINIIIIKLIINLIS